jgi:hypothetical protein
VRAVAFPRSEGKKLRQACAWVGGSVSPTRGDVNGFHGFKYLELR